MKKYARRGARGALPPAVATIDPASFRPEVERVFGPVIVLWLGALVCPGLALGALVWRWYLS